METLSFGISSLLLWLIDTTKYITFLICLIFIIKALTWKKLPAWWHYGLWLLLVLRMLMPWVPESRISMFNYVPVFSTQTSDASFLKENASFVHILTNQNFQLLTLKKQDILEEAADFKQKDDPKHGFWRDLTLHQALLLLWLSGMIGVGLCVVFKNLSFWSVVRKKSPVIDQKILDQLEACKRKMRVRTEVSLVMTDKVKSPALFGYIHPRLLLPEGILERLNQDKLRYVFLHELAHLKRHDIAISWLATVLQAIHWFNPFVWYAFYQMRIDQEIACDTYVLSQLERDQSTRYAHTLVGLLECFLENRSLPALAGILESKSRIRRRIIAIVQNKQYSKSLSFSAVSLFLVIGFTFFTTARGTPTEKTLTVNEQQEIINVQPKATENTFPEAMVRDDSDASKAEGLIQETMDKGKTIISAPSFKIESINDILTRSNEITPDIEGQQKLAEDEQTAEDELTECVKDDMPGTAQPTTNRQEIEEQVQMMVKADAQRVSAEESYENNEQNMSLKDAAITGNKLYAIEKDDLISKQKPDMVLKTGIEEKGTKDIEDDENILYENHLLTSAKKSDSSMGVMNLYPAAPPRDHIDERITITGLLHYLERNGHITPYSHEIARSTEETKVSSTFKEEPHVKESPDSFKFDEPPETLSRGAVTYPIRAKRLGLTGKVFVSFLVDTGGHPTDIKAVKAEPANVLVTFAGAAEKAIAKFRFKPGSNAGEPVPVKVMAPIRFEI